MKNDKEGNLDLNKMMRAGKDSDEILVNDFTEDSAQDFRDRVMEVAKYDPMKPILVYIDSYGGEVDALAKMIETMDEAPNPIVTVAMGKAMSCGAMLLSHGDIRFCGKHSRVMIHEVSIGAGGDVHDVETTAIEGQRLNRYFMNLLAKNCGIKGGYDALRKIIKNQDGRDNFLNAEQALKFGIVDGIGVPKIKKINVYQLEVTPEKRKPARKELVKRKGKKSETKD